VYRVFLQATESEEEAQRAAREYAAEIMRRGGTPE
jgi:hypothetical protein